VFQVHDNPSRIQVLLKGIEMVDQNSCAALYLTHEQAEAVVRVLQQASFDVKKISIVGKGYHQEGHPIGFYNVAHL